LHLLVPKPMHPTRRQKVAEFPREVATAARS
jgi:hypothetical protein